MLGLDQRPDRHEGPDPGRRLDVEGELPARGETLQPPVGPVAHDGPEPRQRLDPVAQELAGGHDVVRPGRAGRGGHRQPQDLDQQGALGADRATAAATGLVERRAVAAAPRADT